MSNNSKELGLQGLNVVCFESRHAKTMADLIKLQGGNAIVAPSMKEVPLENNLPVFSFAEKLFKNEIDVFILLTGVGTKTLVSVLETRFAKNEILAALKKTTIVPRGPKPIRVLKELDVPFALTVPEPNTWKELIETLDQNQKLVPLKNRVVAVQEYGVSNAELLEALEKRQAKVLRVPVYRWELPDDLEPLKKAIGQIVNNQVQVVIFTTAIQIEHVFQVAESMGQLQKLKSAFENLVVASVGPDCTAALVSYKIGVDIEPQSPKMAPLVQEVAKLSKKILQQKKSQDCSVEVKESILNLMANIEEKSDEVLKNSIFLKACRREKTSRAPVWLMRQAGRFMKDYREIRKEVSFLELCKNPDLVTEVTVMAQEKLKVDAAIIFSDILLIVEAMGFSLEYTKNDGPAISPPINNLTQIRQIRDVNIKEKLRFIFEAIKQTRASLKPNIPLIGFAGAPFTLASYLIEGGPSKDFSKTKALMKENSHHWNELLEKITRYTADCLNYQIQAGVQAVQIFDSWVGVLTPEEYKTHVLGYSSKLIQWILPGTPVIHFGTKTDPFLESFSQAGSDVVGVDHRINISDAWRRIGYDKAVQGNLDPALLASGSLDEIKIAVKNILADVSGRPGYIFNLGHGVLPQTPEENVTALVQMVREMSSIS